MQILKKALAAFSGFKGYDLTRWNNFTKENIQHRMMFNPEAEILTLGSNKTPGYIAKHFEGMGKSSFVEFSTISPDGRSFKKGEIKVFFSLPEKNMEQAWAIVSRLMVKHGIEMAKFVRPNQEDKQVIFEGAKGSELLNKPIVVYTHYYEGHGKSRQERETAFTKFLSEAEGEMRKAGIKTSDTPLAGRRIPGSEYISYRNDYAEGFKHNYISAEEAVNYSKPHNPFNRPDFLKDFAFRPVKKENSQPAKPDQQEKPSSRIKVAPNLHGQDFVLVFPKSASEKAIDDYCRKLGFKGKIKGSQNSQKPDEMLIWPTTAEDKKLLADKCTTSRQPEDRQGKFTSREQQADSYRAAEQKRPETTRSK